MKKKLMGLIAIVAVAAVAGYNIYTSQSNVKLSDLALANIEALADPSEGGFDCVNGCVDGGNGCYCYQWYPYFHENYW
ncbi:NVEALA domain-containing protein [uncultured Bacteroides sp.]|jgi:hypothetical protein|uniref:NVEALA domain-containing protein n=1 Tax=uncultured Bacteroides sp. TaxID=162156 RepID=UPI00258EFE06|nr:NVEALA domain-containing protein [uncultured Bacteroides sp.]